MFIRELDASELLKVIWVSEAHPRWPAGSEDSQGGRFSPKGDSSANYEGDQNTLSAGRPQQGSNGLIEVADSRSGPMCREVAAAGCVATSAATAGEGAAAACVATGPGCPVGATVGGAITALGSCLVGGIAAYEACSNTNASNPDRPSDRAIRDQCIQRCWPLLERPEGPGRRGKNEWDFRKCVDECIKEKNEYWGD